MAIGITNNYNSFLPIRNNTAICPDSSAAKGALHDTADHSGYPAANADEYFSASRLNNPSADSTSEAKPAIPLNPFNPNRTECLRQYAARLSKLAPSVEFRIGTTFCKARSGKTLTINPGLLVKMQNDPQQEKDTMDMIKGVEFITKWMDSIYKSTGKTLVYRHSYIDSDGRYSACSYVRNDRSLKMSAAMRKERQKNSQKLIQKTREKSLKQKKALQKKLKKTGAAIDIRL